VADPPLACQLEDVEVAEQVGTRIGARIVDRVPHARLCAKVYDPVDLGGREPLVERVGLREVELVEGEGPAGLAQVRQPRLLQGDRVIVVQIVDPDHGVAAGEQCPGDVHPDEPGDTGDEYRHCHPDPSATSSPCVLRWRGMRQFRRAGNPRAVLGWRGTSP
jgi:hypothetical protein